MTDAIAVPDTLSPPVHHFPSTESPAAPQPVARPLKVFVALCTRDWQSEAHNSESVRNIGRTCNCEIMVRYQMNDGVARSRNNLAAAFLESDADILFFLDNDIIIEPKHFERVCLKPFLEALAPVTLAETLAQRSGARSGKRGIVCALYPKKQPTLDWVVNYLPGEMADADGYLKVKHAGTGAMAITREMLKDFISKHPEIEYRGDPSPDAVRWDLFPMHAENGRYLSEDWKFCEMARADGWEVWVDTRSQLRHIGKIVYPLQFTLTDEEVVDLIVHRYHIYPDHCRAFIASGEKQPGLMGGHREVGVRHWPREFPVGDLHQGDVLAGCYDVPYYAEEGKPFGVIDIGADVGGFARWASKRWDKCPIHCYEGNAALLPCLEVTAQRCGENFGLKPTVYPLAVRAKDMETLPEARVIKIDAAGLERELVEALCSIGRAGEFDAIMIKYYDELTAYFLERLLAATHFKHNHQRFAQENVGIVKFLRRGPKQ
jgi:hypothetical protein